MTKNNGKRKKPKDKICFEVHCSFVLEESNQGTPDSVLVIQELKDKIAQYILKCLSIDTCRIIIDRDETYKTYKYRHKLTIFDRLRESLKVRVTRKKSS